MEGHEEFVVSCEAFDLDVLGEWTCVELVVV